MFMLMQVKKTKLIPPVYVALSMLGMYLIFRYMPFFKLDGVRIIGVIIMFSAIAVGFYCGYLFYKHKTAIHPFDDSSALIASWPYSMSRNPIYLMMVLFLIGFALALEELLCLALVPVFVYWIHVRFVLQEEIMLEQTFSEKYLDYKRKVRRWI